MSFAAGARLGPYEILSALDIAGIGEIYRARDHDQQRDVAFRVLRTDFGADPERHRRFEEDARAAAGLTHPNILAVYDIGTDAQAAYIVSEPLEGATLRESLSRVGVLPAGTVIQYALQMAQGLAAAHEKGIVHRDLKPENILIGTDGRVRILGFGLATLTQSESALAGLKGSSDGVVLGAPGYTSPEQARGVAADPRSDMFIFGAIVYEMLSGARAFSGETPVETMTAVLKSDPPKLPASDVPPMLARTVDLCLRKHPGSRPSAGDVMGVLHSLSFQQAPVAPPAAAHTADVAAPSDFAPRQGRRIGRIVAVLGLVVLAAVAGSWLLRVVRGPSTSSTTRPATSAPPAATPTPRPPPPSATPSTLTPAPAGPPPSTSAPAAAASRPPAPTAPASKPAPPAPTAPASKPAPPVPTAPASKPAPPAPPRSTPSASTPTRSLAPPASTPSTRTPPAPAPATPRRAAAGPQESQLLWFDREGKQLGGVSDPADYGDVSLSPDGMRMAVSVRERGSDAADIWVVDVGSGMRTRLTSDPADDIAPVWSPDGRRILFASARGGSLDIYQKAANGTGNEVAIIDAQGDQIAYDWSSNGRYLVYQTNQPRAIAGGNLDLWARPLPSGRPFAFLRTVHAASRATFSPDGSQVAYTSLEGGREDVYIARFPRYNGRRRISPRGGSWSRWRRDGSEMFYLDADNRLMAVPMKGGVETGPARLLFQTRAKPNRGYAYDVSADGRILVNTLER